jgi:hypothetical protein
MSETFKPLVGIGGRDRCSGPTPLLKKIDDEVRTLVQSAAHLAKLAPHKEAEIWMAVSRIGNLAGEEMDRLDGAVIRGGR